MADGAVAQIRLALEGSPAVVTGLQTVEKQFSSLKSGIAGLAAGLTVGAFASAIKNQLELADAMAKTAERTGLQLKEVAGLQLAYSMAGVSSDKLETSIGKMAKNMAEGSQAFGAMGVQIKNSDGSLRSTREVLGDVADKLASYRDGAEKTALAQELFGKSGTEMISVLNGGAEALAESDAQAKKLGLTLDEDATAKAVQFNDTLSLLQAGGEGFTRQIAGRLAPTLASLAGEMLNNVHQSESLDTISSALSTTLKGLYSAGAIGAQIFANLGRAVGAGAAAIMAVLRGDFAAAKDIMADVSSVNAAAWKGQLESLGRLWNDTGAAGVQAMATTAAAAKAAAPIVSKVGEAAKNVEGAYTSMMKVLSERLASANQELAMGRQLTDMEKFEVKIKTDLALAAGKLTEAQKQTILSTLADVKASTLALEVKKSLIEIEDRHRSALQDVAKAESSRMDDVAKSNTDLREQIATMGLTNQQIRQRTIELNRATIAEKEQQLARLQTGYTNTREQAALEEEIRLLKERNGLLSDQGVKEQYVAAQQEITDTWVSIDRTAHDTFVNIFEDGAGTFKRLGQTLKAALLDMLYQMTVKRWIINIGASMGATGGIFAAGNAVAGQGGSALGLLGNAGSLTGGFGGIGGMASGFMNGLSAWGAEGSVTGVLSNPSLYTMPELLGAAAPIIGGVALLANAFGLFRSLERKGGGLTGTLGQAGGVHDVDLMRRGGTLFSGPDWFTEDKGVSALDRAIQQQFTASKDAIKGFAETLGLSTDKIDGFTTALGTATMGDHGQLGIRLDKDGKPLSDQEIQSAIAEAIKAGSNELAQQLIGTWTESVEQVTRTVVGTTGGSGDGWDVRQVTEDRTTRSYTPSEFARDGEQAIDTLTRLATSLQGVNAMFDTLGLTLYEASLKGGDMASQLADAAGGLDKLQASSASYFQNFYTGSEQHATALRQLQEQMTRMGVETIPYTRAQFRDLVESLDLTTEEGRKMYAGLLAISEAFAAVTPQLFQGGQTLADAIAQGLLGTFDGGDLGAYMAQTVSDGINNAVAGYFAQQITDIMLQGVINPMIQAAITGSSVSAAVSQATIDQMIAQATAVAEAAAAVLNDPAFREALERIGKAVSGIGGSIQRSTSSVASYTSAVRDSGSAAAQAEQAADRISDAWKSIGDSLMDEVNRIRGVMNETAGQGVDYWQAQFAIAKAQAMAGDQDAAKSLAGISQNLLRAGEGSAGSALELQRLRAQMAQELQDMARYAYGQGGVLPAQPQLPGGATTGGNMWTGIGVGSPLAALFAPPPPAPSATTGGNMWTGGQLVAPPRVEPPAGASNADVVAELKALRQAIEAGNRNDTDLQRRTVRVLERMDTLGMPPARIEA